MGKKRYKCIDCDNMVHVNGRRCRSCYVLFSKGENVPSWKPNQLRIDGKIAVECECVQCEDSFLKIKSTIKKTSPLFCSKKCKYNYYVEHFWGENHHSWKGGYTSFKQRLRQDSPYKTWRSKIFERDNYTCQECNERGGELHAHHIITFVEIINKHGIDNLTDAMECKELWDTDNGITYCKDCHKILHDKLREAV